MIGGALLGLALAAPVEIDVRVDRRVMATTITMWLAREEGDPDPMAGLPDYEAALQAHFGAHRDHRAVQLAGQLARAGFTFDAPVGWALHLDERTLAPRTDVPAYYARRAGDAERLAAYRAELADFAREARLDDFLDAMGPVHAEEVARVRGQLDVDSLSDLQWFYGDPEPASYSLLLVPTLGVHHYGPTVRGPQGVEHYQVSNTLRKRSDAGLRLALDDLLLHEFGHPLAKPVVEGTVGRLAKVGATLMEPIQGAMREQAYPTWPLAYEEHLVRAVTCRLLRRRHGSAVGQECLAGEVRRGFRYVVPLYEALAEYEQRRDRFPTLRSYGRQLVRTLEGVAREGPEAWWSTTDWSAFPSAPMSVVLPTGERATPELQQAARALAEARYGGRLVTDSEALLAPTESYVVVGGPRSNRLASAFSGTWPVSVDGFGAQVGGHRFDSESVAVSAAIDGPGARWLLLLGNTPEAELQAVDHVPGPRAWVVAPEGGDPCAQGHLPPHATLSPNPRHLRCDPMPPRRLWVPRGLGTALPWASSVPAELMPGRFRAALDAAVSTCAPWVEVAVVDCDEAPCVAGLRVEGRAASADADVVACDPWRVPLGPARQRLTASVPCGEGQEQVVLLAPTPLALRTALGPQSLYDRLAYRFMQALGEWSCASEPEPSGPVPRAAAPR